MHSLLAVLGLWVNFPTDKAPNDSSIKTGDMRAKLWPPPPEEVAFKKHGPQGHTLARGG